MNTDLMKLKNGTIKFTIICILVILIEIFFCLTLGLFDIIIFMALIQIFILGFLSCIIKWDWDYYLYFERFYEYINTNMAQELFKVQVGVEDNYMKFIVYLHNIMYTMPGIKIRHQFVILPDFLHNEIINYIEENYTISSKDIYVLDHNLDKLIFISKDTVDCRKMFKYYKKLKKLEDKIYFLNEEHKEYLNKEKDTINLTSMHDI